MTKLYLDFDSFFASAEQHFNPALRGRPVGVVPLDVRHTGCIAISREAKRAGVPSGASVTEARAIAPEMIFVVARPDAYVRLHHRILEVIESCLPIEEVRSIDELVCDLVASEAAQGRVVAQRIKMALSDAFGATLTCSIGIGPSELLAKIAAEMHKPDGQVILHEPELPGAIAHLRLSDIPGISKGIGARLEKAGITDVPALWRLGAKEARGLWGSIEGERFWNALHGLPYARPVSEKRMFGHSRMLPLDWRTPERVHDCARQLALSAARRLRRTDLKATQLTLSVRGGGFRTGTVRQSDHQRWSAEVHFEAMRDDASTLEELAVAIVHYRREIHFKPRSVTVMLHGLVDAAPAQEDLFNQPGLNDQRAAVLLRQQKRERLSGALDAIRSKHGPSSASWGVCDDIPGGYVGGKIAFGRIPELADFNEAPCKDEATHFCVVV
ncbi:hypothetical protein [Novosphingobium sp.]|uniref:Y-family DNA polymerase n=1 Tax=Novosphingobium sp. TaxID=1874826 RepID=UPI002604F35B|nr:hypothetical protein [Novosphingobium sp.]